MSPLNYADEVAKLDSEAQKITSPCAEGELVFRYWAATKSTGRKPLLLVHGGSGSWTHWYQNIRFLRQHYDVYALDLPGLGNSASLPAGYTASDAVEVVERGIRAVFSDEPMHVSAFSWGCAVMSQVCARLPNQFLSLTLVGPASLGDKPGLSAMQPLIKKTPSMNAAEIFEANRKNLARLMIFDQSKIDDLAVYLQTENTIRARFNSPQFGKTRLTLDGVAAHCIPLQVIYGSEDVPAKPDVAGKAQIFREVRPDVVFHLIGNCGHWLQYEKPEIFHRLILNWTNRNEMR
jgi:2-hydroxy-6-oxonona-2,4-dienedioate hydrolase